MMLVPNLAHCPVIKTNCYKNETNTVTLWVSECPGDYPMLVQHDKVIDMLVMKFSTPSRFTLLA
ncbi:hypothetical protein FIBSPDRAFT_878558 [Athelia psychrophila]|uniref:Uncharacterized protein n=1 Tax=Athelia psychrophila TaxID=1759441 RepID=A0A167UW93_9AGAM|nr:hypothetical protein FIBSPDRAFT_878558 [Fibularhizoctonia sp. CBS 109695]